MKKYNNLTLSEKKLSEGGDEAKLHRLVKPQGSANSSRLFAPRFFKNNLLKQNGKEKEEEEKIGSF